MWGQLCLRFVAIWWTIQLQLQLQLQSTITWLLQPFPSQLPLKSTEIYRSAVLAGLILSCNFQYISFQFCTYAWRMSGISTSPKGYPLAMSGWIVDVSYQTPDAQYKIIARRITNRVLIIGFRFSARAALLDQINRRVKTGGDKNRDSVVTEPDQTALYHRLTNLALRTTTSLRGDVRCWLASYVVSWWRALLT